MYSDPELHRLVPCHTLTLYTLHPLTPSPSTAEQHVEEVLALGAVSGLLHLLSSSDQAIRTHAIICLAAMATNG